MKIKDWISPDDYHLEDLLAQGRCLRCGRLAEPGYNREYKGFVYYYCSDECDVIVHDAIDEITS